MNEVHGKELRISPHAIDRMAEFGLTTGDLVVAIRDADTDYPCAARYGEGSRIAQHGGFGIAYVEREDAHGPFLLVKTVLRRDDRWANEGTSDELTRTRALADRLKVENEQLREQLSQARDTIAALRSGDEVSAT